MQSVFENDYGESTLLLYERSQNRDEGVEFETESITNNRIEGFLPCRCFMEDEIMKYRYGISGYTTLSGKYRHEEMKADVIRRIIEGVVNIYKNAEDYLLNQAHILLNPEYLFWSRDRGGIAVCYFPPYGVGRIEELKKLAEFMIERTDHTDDQAIELSYGFYQCVQTGDFRFEALLNRVQSLEPVIADEPVSHRKETAQRYIPREEVSRRSPRRNSSDGGKAVLSLLSIFLIVCLVICFMLLNIH